MKNLKNLLACLLLTGLMTTVQAQLATSDYKIDRTFLPIQPPKAKQITVMDARDATKPALFEVKAPEGAYLTNKTQFNLGSV